MRDICVFGEVLFDCFDDGTEVLGGAPFNVAWHLQAFGASPSLVSRVGDDGAGRRVRESMVGWGLDTSQLQIDPKRPTGRVQVNVVDGEPHYDIVEGCAYDAIAPPPVDCRGLLYHGSLAVRADTSTAALRHLRDQRPSLVFIDVNLRPPWWEPGQVRELLAGAHWVKLNQGELEQLYPGQAPGSDPAKAFLEYYGLQGLILTRGEQGAEVLTADGGRWSARPEPDVRVVDTVGAGDALAAVMILGLTRDWPPELSLDRAQQFAARIVARRGATVADPAFYDAVLRDWGLRAPVARG